MPRDRAPRVLAVDAFAKVNLTLRVLGRRPDGFHEVRTMLQSLVLHDSLLFHREPGPFRLECDDPACAVDRTNLVWRAVDQMWRAAGRPGAARDLRVRIRKRIPQRAGLGGGSSDAAATLRALAVLWNLRLNRDRLHDLAAGLGADVPFFLEGGTALGVEKGDIVYPLPDAPAAWVVLVLPAFGVSTADAYLWLDRDRRARPPWTAGRGSPTDGRAAPGWTLPTGERGNDLEGPVGRRHPAIPRLVRALVRHGASHAAMSGSGSAVFGLYAGERDARSAAAALDTGRWRTIVTPTMSRRRYRAAAAPRWRAGGR
jgi:4-diphosphocytidyl-2-C-methyl-D-erythritol kinase